MIHIIQETNVIHIRYQLNIPENIVENVNGLIVSLIEKYGIFAIHLDLKGLNITTLMRNLSWVESIFSRVDSNQYNQYLEEVLIFNAPFISKQIYSIIKRWFKDIKNKVKFLPKNITSETYLSVNTERENTMNSSVSL